MRNIIVVACTLSICTYVLKLPFFLLYAEKDLAESILRVLEADPPSRDKAPLGASGLKLVSQELL